VLFYFSLGILALTLGAQLVLRFFIKRDPKLQIHPNAPNSTLIKIVKYIFLFSVFLIFTLLFYQSFKQYQSWSQNEVFQYLLPPYRSMSYFIFFAFTRFFAPYLVSLTIAILFFLSAKALNEKYEECFFYPEEYYLGALAIFLAGHPGWLFYVIAVLLIYLLIHLFTLIYYKFKEKEVRVSPREARPIATRGVCFGVRVSPRYLWLPVAIFVILIERWLEILPLWRLLKI